jgi:hypothetical protein
MRLVQFVAANGERRVGRVGDDGRSVQVLSGVKTTYELARQAARDGRALADLAAAAGNGEMADLNQLLAAGRVLAPLDHPDPAHCLVTGTGLTHLGSAQARDAMHQALQQDEGELSDSMKMFKLGLEGGKPAGVGSGVAPEWFYKGDGSIVAAPGKPLLMPSFALDGGEEAEIAMLYVIDDAGLPCRVGFALGNEFSDHVLERQNYLYLAHSKLRPCAFGPELLLGELPDDVRGTVSVLRGEERLWQSEFLSGRRTCRTRWPTSSTTTSNMRCSAAPATCTCTSLAPRCSAAPPASGPSPATCSRSRLPPSAPPCATRSRSPLTRACGACVHCDARRSIPALTAAWQAYAARWVTRCSSRFLSGSL